MGSEFKWHLTWSGMKDSAMNRAAFEHCKVINLWEVSEATIVTHAEYVGLIRNSDIQGAEDYWQVKKGQIGVVTLSMYHDNYQQTWETISLAKQDFIAGWKECMKHR